MLIIEKFKSGTYRNQGDFKSFVPFPINDTWTWSSPDINSLLSNADQELGALGGLSEFITDIELYIRMHIRVEANKSNRIEGTNTTVLEDMMPTEELNPEKRDDVTEVENYIAAMEYGIKRIMNDGFPFSSRLLRELHSILLRGGRGEHKTPGEFRTSQNFIGGSKPSDAAYVPPAAIDLYDLMNDFDKFMNRNDDLPVLIRLAIMHYQFETIHPFLDGNGRIGRLMIPLYLLSSGKLHKPCFYISDYFESHRSEYYDALQAARRDNDMHRWICFFLRASIETAGRAKLIFHDVLSVVSEYNEYIASKKSSPLAFGAIIKEMYSQPVSTVGRLSQATGLSIPTINNAVNTMCSDSILREITGGRRNRIFELTKYIEAFTKS